jgi:gamma-glutamyltranspeptidase/glutathione hydrolase
MTRPRQFSLVAAVAATLFAVPLWVSGLGAGQAAVAPAGSRTATGTHAMVATAHPLASRAALDILRKGGNAIDAAVAAAFVVGVVEPDASGLGGGGGMLIRLASGKAVYINYYGHAPHRIADANYVDATDSKSAKAVLVPGNVGGLAKALKDYGTLPLSDVMAPAIRCAEEGFVVDETLSRIVLDNVGVIASHPGPASLFLHEEFPLQEGERLVQPVLAATMKAIARGGPRAFYEGAIAKTIVDEIGKAGGVLSLDDLRAYAPIVAEPVSGSYRGYQILSSPPPHSGAVVIEALQILENADLRKMGPYTTSADAFHVVAEAMRRAYADRVAFVADPRREDVPTAGLLSKDYARDRFASIDMAHVVPPDYTKTPSGDPTRFVPAKGEPSDSDEASGAGHTTHISVMDKAGNAVSLTQTLGTFFGSGAMAAGVLFNNGVNNFAVKSRRNRLEPDKQPRSSISPSVLVRDGKAVMVLGSPGANRIMSTVITLVINVVDHGMSAEQANAAARFLCQKADPVLSMESRFAPDVIRSMEQRGHRFQPYGPFDLFFGGAQIIVVDPVSRTYSGSADPRRGGTAMGY